MPKSRLLALALAVSVPLSAQQFQEKIDVHYLEVPVTVLKDNAPVRGLTKANFEVIDDGQKRNIESFEAIDFTKPETVKKVSPLNPASRRNFLLLFDLSFSSPITLGRAQEAARNFVARSVGKRDLVGVAIVDVERGFRFLTSFTTDRTLLDAAISDPRNFRAFDPLQIAGSAGLALVPDDPMAEAMMRQEAATNPAAEQILDLKRAIDAADDAYRRARIEKQVDTLGTIARSLQKLSGRKHIVLLSEGFDPRLVQGRSASDSAEQTEENSAVSSGQIWRVDSDKRFGNASAQSTIQRMAKEFARADAVMHAVDIQGVRVQNDIRTGAKVNLNDGLFLLANSTGGDVFRNTNDINQDFDRLLRQQEVVYVLGFRVPAGKAGQFRDLKVKLRDVPGARVVHRDGYYAAGAESNVERALTTAEIILNDLPQNDIDVAALATSFPRTQSEAQVPVIMEISGPDLIAAARNNAATVDIFAYAFDDEGVVRDRLHQRMRLDVSQVGERLRTAGVKFYGTLHLAPGRYAVKTLVRVPESEKTSFRRLDVEVPEPGVVAVTPPMFFADAGSWVMVKADSTQKPSAPYPFVLNGEPFIPAARATLGKGESRNFTVWVWNAHPDELTWETSPEAKLVSRTDGDAIKLVFALQPTTASSLDVTIKKKGSSDERRVSTPIGVRQP